MTKRLLTVLAAIGGLTVLIVAFVALYSLRGQVAGGLTRAQGESPITGAQALAGETEANDQDEDGGDEAGEADAPEADMFFEVGDPSGAFTARTTARLDLVEEPGVVVSALVKDGAAAKAGVKRGDIVLAVDDQKVDDMRGLMAALKDKQAGDSVALSVRHGDAERKLTATLGDQAGQGFLGILPCGPGGGMVRAVRVSGPAMRLHDGAFVESVVADGPAAKAGLKDTDVITAVDGKAIDKDNDLADLIAAHKPGDTVALSIHRRQETREAGDGNEGDDEKNVTFEIKIEPVELKVVLGENPDKAGAAYLGLRYLSGGPMVWHHAMPGMPAMPAMPLEPGEPMVAPLPHMPGVDGEAPEGGDVFFFHDAATLGGGEDAAGGLTFEREIPAGALPGSPGIRMKFKAGAGDGMHTAPVAKDV